MVLAAGVAGWLPVAAAALLLPRLEQFHLSPFSERTRAISGRFNDRSVTCSAFEKIRGINSTPTFKDLAFTNGALLKAGSSAMEISSAVTPPFKIDKERFPTLTCRPRALVNSDSIRGRDTLTSTKQGIAMTITLNTPRT